MIDEDFELEISVIIHRLKALRGDNIQEIKREDLFISISNAFVEINMFIDNIVECIRLNKDGN